MEMSDWRRGTLMWGGGSRSWLIVAVEPVSVVKERVGGSTVEVDEALEKVLVVKEEVEVVTVVKEEEGLVVLVKENEVEEEDEAGLSGGLMRMMRVSAMEY